MLVRCGGAAEYGDFFFPVLPNKYHQELNRQDECSTAFFGMTTTGVISDIRTAETHPPWDDQDAAAGLDVRYADWQRIVFPNGRRPEGLIYFGSGGGGDDLFVDLMPGRNGIAGQV